MRLQTTNPAPEPPATWSDKTYTFVILCFIVGAIGVLVSAVDIFLTWITGEWLALLERFTASAKGIYFRLASLWLLAFSIAAWSKRHSADESNTSRARSNVLMLLLWAPLLIGYIWFFTAEFVEGFPGRHSHVLTGEVERAWFDKENPDLARPGNSTFYLKLASAPETYSYYCSVWSRTSFSPKCDLKKLREFVALRTSGPVTITVSMRDRIAGLVQDDRITIDTDKLRRQWLWDTFIIGGFGWLLCGLIVWATIRAWQTARRWERLEYLQTGTSDGTA